MHFITCEGPEDEPLAAAAAAASLSIGLPSASTAAVAAGGAISCGDSVRAKRHDGGITTKETKKDFRNQTSKRKK